MCNTFANVKDITSPYSSQCFLACPHIPPNISLMVYVHIFLPILASLLMFPYSSQYTGLMAYVPIFLPIPASQLMSLYSYKYRPHGICSHIPAIYQPQGLCPKIPLNTCILAYVPPIFLPILASWLMSPYSCHIPVSRLMSPDCS